MISQPGTVGPSLLAEQEISYQSWPLAPGCSVLCEKIRNYNSIITIINYLSSLLTAPGFTSSSLVQSNYTEMNAMFCFQRGTVEQLNTFHVNINWRFSASECLSVSAELSVIGTNLYLQLTDWMWAGCREEINTYYSPEIFRGIRKDWKQSNQDITSSQLDEVTFTVLCLSRQEGWDHNIKIKRRPRHRSCLTFMPLNDD